MTDVAPAKLLVTVLSVAVTLGGWVALAHTRHPAAEPALPPMPALIAPGMQPPVVRRVDVVTRASR